MAGAFCGALVCVALAYRMLPPDGRFGGALRLTARWSFCLFWLSYVGSSLHTLLGARFKPLSRHGRDFGLSFAAAHLVHLGLVVILLANLEKPFPRVPLVFFGIGALCTYVVALLSFERVSALLSVGACRLIRTAGVHYIALAFLVDFAKNPFDRGVGKAVAYIPFLALALAGPALRAAALIKRESESRRMVTQ